MKVDDKENIQRIILSLHCFKMNLLEYSFN